MPSPIYPPVRTFHARHGRLGPAARAALTDVLPRLDIANLDPPVDLRGLLPGRPIVIDFGTGMGHHALSLAERGAGVLAVDVHAPGIARLAAVSAPGMVLHLGDGVELLRSHIADACADEVHIMFPDPWPKARHAKRRLVQAQFLDVVARVLAPGGLVAIVTDHDDYAHHITATVPSHPDFTVTDEPFDWEPTRYHERARRLGHSIHVITMRRNV